MPENDFFSVTVNFCFQTNKKIYKDVIEYIKKKM